jgi:hypothetical protein
MIAAALVAAQYMGTLEVSDRIDVRERYTQELSGAVAAPTPNVVNPPAVIDVADQFTGRATWTDRRWELEAAYLPMLTVPAVGVAPYQLPQLLHIGRASIAWHSRAVRLMTTGGMTYGELNSAFLYQPQGAVGQTTAVQAALRPQTIRFLAWNADGSVNVQLDRRSALTFGGGYQESGQIDPPSTGTLLPLQKGPRASASFDYALTPNDHLVTSAAASAVDFSSMMCTPLPGAVLLPTMTCAPQTEFAWIQEALDHLVSPRTRVTLGAGIGGGETRDATLSIKASYPVGTALLDHTFGSKGESELLASARLMPVVDIYTGDVSDRLQLTLSLIEQLTGLTTLRVSATGVQSVLPANDPFTLTLATGEAQAGFKLDRRLELALGDQILWDRQKNVGTFVSLICYIAMTLKADPLHF